jgi:hypothetical protein
LTELIKKLVVLDSEWIPKDKGYSLYIRMSILSWSGELLMFRTNHDRYPKCSRSWTLKRCALVCHLLSGMFVSADMFITDTKVGPYYASKAISVANVTS